MGRAHQVRAASMAKTAAFKSKQNAKYAMAIYSAAKSGVPDPEMNRLLKKEIEKAKKAHVPADVIQRQIDKASGKGGTIFKEVRYEGRGPSNSLLIINAVTDNENRTLTHIRTAFGKNGGALGTNGSVTYNFEHCALFSYEGDNEDEYIELLLENDCDITKTENEDGIVTIYAPSSEFTKIRKVFEDNIPDMQFLEDNIAWIPKEYVKLSDDELQKFIKLQNALGEIEDIQEVHHNIEGVE